MKELEEEAVKVEAGSVGYFENCKMEQVNCQNWIGHKEYQ